MTKSLDYHEHLIQSLQDPEEALAYLNAALEAGDLRMFLVAVRNVAEAGVRTSVRKRRAASLAKELARKGSLSIGRVEELLSLLGFRLTVGFKDAA